MPVINLRGRKRELRAKYKRLREACPPDIKRELDRGLTEKFLTLEEFRSCKTLFCFISSPIECDTSGIIRAAFECGKRVAVPKCLDAKGKMDFYYITSDKQLKRGFYGIMEPDAELCEKVSDFSSGLCVLPGLCFDFEGYRIGFGGGYYDRFLEKFKGITAGICYSRYVEKKLPAGTYDMAADILVTEKFINYSRGMV